MRRLVPMVDNSLRMLSLEPCPMAIMIITAATPMMMPNMLKKERILLLATAFRLTLNKFDMFIISLLHYDFLIILWNGQGGEGLGCRLDIRIDGVFANLAVAQIDVTRGKLGNFRIVGHENDGVALTV